MWAFFLLPSAQRQTLGLELVAVSRSACPVTPAQDLAGLPLPEGKKRHKIRSAISIAPTIHRSNV